MEVAPQISVERKKSRFTLKKLTTAIEILVREKSNLKPRSRVRVWFWEIERDLTLEREERFLIL